MDKRLESLITAYRDVTGRAPDFMRQSTEQGGQDFEDENPPVSKIVTMLNNSLFKESLLRGGNPHDLAFAAKPLTTRYYETGEEAHIVLAIDFLQSAIGKFPDEAATARAEALHDLGVAFYLRFNRSGDLNDLNEAIENQRKSVDMTPDDNPIKTTFLSNLGNSYSLRFEQTGQVADLTEAITVQQKSLALIPAENPDRPGLLNNLSASFEAKFSMTGDLEDLLNAISTQQEALASTLDGHPNKPLILGNLGALLDSLYEQTSDLADLERAIQYQKDALILIPETHSHRPRMLSSLAASLRNRFMVKKTADDIEESIKLLHEATNLTTEEHPARPGILHKLGQSLQSQSTHLGSPELLKEAIEYKERAESLLSDDHPEKPFYLSSIGISYRKQFAFSGALADIDGAIRNQQQAILASPEEAVDRRNYLNSLGVSFMARYHRTEDLHDLNEAIRAFQDALSSTPDDHPGKPLMSSNLGTALETRFEKTSNLSDLAEAANYQKQALSLTPEGSSDKAGMLLNLGDTLLTQYKQTREFTSLESAIHHMEEAAALSTNDPETRPEILSNLGNALEVRYEETRDQDDVENAVRCHLEALDLIPEGHAARAGLLLNLATTRHAQFEATGENRYLDQSIGNYRSAVTTPVGSPLVRFKAARQWSKLAAMHHLPSANEAFSTAMGLIPQIAWVGDNISKRHAQLSEIGDFPKEAAAFALTMQKADLALEWLEQGRSIIWNQLLSLHTPVDDLKASYPDIASEFSEVSRSLHSAGVQHQEKELLSDDENFSLEEEARQHHRLAEQWEGLLKRIRLLPKFEDFLLPKQLAVLKKAVTTGPIVVINIHTSRCDALVLEPGKDQVTHIPLNKLRYEDIQKMQDLLKKNLSSHNVRSREARAGGLYPGMARPQQSSLDTMLSEMYKKIVQPILDALGLKKKKASTDQSSLPRLWWCPTGPLTFLPLHAACQDIQKGGDETSQYVVSSYIPTVNALLEAKKSKRPPTKRFLGIAMTHTPNLPSLPNAETELMEICKFFGPNEQRDWTYREFQNEEAIAEKVLSEMAESSWVHLACHAVQDIAEPTQSGLCLHDQRLDILDIIAKPFLNADLAFLSACETATGDEKASDEALHITGSMLGAGYRGVIGTMWSIPDEAAPIVASSVYKSLLADVEPSSERAAYALHEAVKELRKSNALENAFYAWAPFVHFGI